MLVVSDQVGSSVCRGHFQRRLFRFPAINRLPAKATGAFVGNI
jgi:hypothetical protein